MMISASTNPTVVFKGARDVAVEELPVPRPAKHEVLIRTHCSLVSIGTELSVLDAEDSNGLTWRSMQQFPFHPGYANVGTIVDAGKDVEHLQIGQRVVSWGRHGAYVVIDADRCWPVTRDVSDEEASFLILFHVAMNGIRRSKLVVGESVAIFGLGIIGQLTAQLCLHAGARPVIGIDAADQRANLLRELAGACSIVAGQENVIDQVSRWTRRRMVDVVFELTGNAELIPQECAVLRDQGRLVIVSSPRSKVAFDFHDDCNRRSLSIIGAHNWSHPEHATPESPWTMARHAELFFDLIADGDLNVASMITHRLPIEAASTLYSQLLCDRSTALGAILKFQ